MILFISFLFPICMFLGYSYATTGTWNLLVNNTIQSILLNVIIIFLSGIVLNKLITKLFKIIDCFVSKQKIEEKTWSFRYNIIAMLIMLVFWSPYTIAHLPGSVPYDGMTQLLEHFGRIPHYAHHPVFVTRLYGYIVQFGAYINSYNLGVFFVVVFQALFCSAVFSRVSYFILDIWNSKKIWILSVMFYALHPIFGSYVSAVLKDTFYIAVSTWFMLEVCRFITNHKANIVMIIISAVLVCFVRKEGIILTLVTGMALILVYIKRNGIKSPITRKIIAATALIVVINSGFNYYVYNICGIQKGEISEALSVVFQQTARYVSEYPDEVTEEEKAAIDAVLPYEEIADAYNPELSDPVKGKMRSEATHADYLNYAITWLKMGLKKPGVYIQATLNNTYGYFYPLFEGGVYQTGIDHSQTARWGTEELDIYYLDEDSELEQALFKLVIFVGRIPIVGLLYNTGFYFWIILLSLAYIFKSTDKGKIVILVFPILTYMVCFASPVNGTPRYALVIYSSIIMIIASILKKSSFIAD